MCVIKPASLRPQVGWLVQLVNVAPSSCPQCSSSWGIKQECASGITGPTQPLRWGEAPELRAPSAQYLAWELLNGSWGGGPSIYLAVGGPLKFRYTTEMRISPVPQKWCIVYYINLSFAEKNSCCRLKEFSGPLCIESGLEHKLFLLRTHQSQSGMFVGTS